MPISAVERSAGFWSISATNAVATFVTILAGVLAAASAIINKSIMSTEALLLIAAVAGVGVLHTVVPDHWTPIALVAK